ncbi:MAG: hypothetical protein KJ718_04385 [Nanoarchaeota archaeon]|nr:hypothetical protein [Nanoarchaeota archaeon]MBU1051767.1 hypothetical protein [Nanoarchaeota archaeon]MBU1988352.1 hypothetical protein [Nanoarchaeota archaeon]
MPKEKTLTKQDQKHIEKHIDNQLSKQVLTKAEFLSHQFKQHISTAIIAAFSFLIALTWKDLVVHAVESLIKEDTLTKTPYLSDLISAGVITLVAIIGILLVTTWARKPHIIQSETQTS